MVSDRRSPARPRATACVMLRLSWLDQNLAEYDAILQQSKCLIDLYQGQLPVDDRLELARPDQVQQRRKVFPHPAVRSPDVELERPDESEVLLRVVAGGGPAGENASLPMQRPQRRNPSVAAGEIHDDVDATVKAAAMRLAISGIDPVDEIL